MAETGDMPTITDFRPVGGVKKKKQKQKQSA